MRHSKKGKLIFIPFVVAGVALGLGALVMLLWNAVLPKVTAARPITYWQAVALLVLCRLLVGGFGGRRGGPPGGGKPQWGRALKDRWMGMSGEEREQFKNEWKQRCGRRGNSGNEN